MKHHGYPIVIGIPEAHAIDVAGCWLALPAYRPPGDVEFSSTRFHPNSAPKRNGRNRRNRSRAGVKRSGRRLDAPPDPGISTNMTIALQEIGDETTVDAVSLRYEVDGRLDAESSHEVRAVEREAPADSVVEIDLQRCSGIDDFGFGSLVGLIRRAREHRARVRLWGADETLRGELRRTGVARLVDLMPYTDTKR